MSLLLFHRGAGADCVRGVDFDDVEYGFKEEDKDFVKV